MGRLRLQLLALLVSGFCCLAPAVLAVDVHPPGAPGESRLEPIDQHLRRGEWEAAAGMARDAIAVLRRSPFGNVLAPYVASLAVAEAGLRREPQAVWHWQVAQNLDPRALTVETLRGYGPPGELLSRNPLRSPGQPPAGLEVRTSPDRPHRLQGAEPRIPADIQALPVPKWLRVQLVIDGEGRPRDPVVLGGGLPGMIYETLEALRDWRFEPVLVDGRPTPVFYEIAMNPPAGKPLADRLSRPSLTSIEQSLRAGQWKQAQSAVERTWSKALDSTPPLSRPEYAAALALEALTEAGGGMEEKAICHWQAAQALDPEIYQADLSSYGAAGALLARNRWGDRLPKLADSTPDVKGAKVTRRSVPTFLSRLRIQGVATIRVAGIIDARGGLRQPIVISSNLSQGKGPELLEAAALESVCGWRFQPATLAGQPVAVTQVVPFELAPRLPVFETAHPPHAYTPPQPESEPDLRGPQIPYRPPR